MIYNSYRRHRNFNFYQQSLFLSICSDCFIRCGTCMTEYSFSLINNKLFFRISIPITIPPQHSCVSFCINVCYWKVVVIRSERGGHWVISETEPRSKNINDQLVSMFTFSLTSFAVMQWSKFIHACWQKVKHYCIFSKELKIVLEVFSENIECVSKCSNNPKATESFTQQSTRVAFGFLGHSGQAPPHLQ